MSASRPTRLPRAITHLALVMLLCAPTAAEAARELVRLVPKRVVVLPARVLPSEDAEPFFDAQRPPDPDPPPGALTLSKQLLERLSAQPEFEAHGYIEVVAALQANQNLESGAGLARDSIKLGVDQYRDLRVSDAATTLQRAARLTHDNLVDLLDPKVVSRLYLTLGLAWLEQGHTEDAQDALQQVFFYEPNRSFQRGFYPANVEEALARAHSAFHRRGRPGEVSVHRDTPGRLHAVTGLDHALTIVLRADHPKKAQVHIFDLRRGVPVLDDEIRLDEDGQPTPDAVDRLVSRFVACEVFERVVPPDPEAPYKAGLLEADFGYHLYLQHPTRAVFHNVAVGVGAGKGFSRNFGAFFRLWVLSSLQDRNRDLDDRLVSLRLAAGPEFRLAWRPLDLYFAPGFEVHLLPNYVVLTSPECKFFGADHPRCASPNVKEISPETLVGFHTAAGARIHLPNDFYLGLSLHTGLYLFPAGRGENLDFPFTAQMAMGFRL